MKILTIIVSYNFEHWIYKCLNSLRNSSVKTDVLVIDNASSDKTTERIVNDFPEIELIKSDVNLGFGQANNIGFQKAIKEEYDAVFLLNQDAWIESETLEILIKASKENQNAGIISPVHLSGNGDKLDPGFADYCKLNSINDIDKSHNAIPTQFVNAAFWLIPIDKLKIIGGFSPLFFHYGEDIDFVNRLHKKGLNIIYTPNAYGFHDRYYRKTTYNDFLRAERVYLMSEYANINYSFPKAFAFGILAGIKKGFKHIALFGITFNLLMLTKKVIVNRKKSLANECFIFKCSK